MCVYIYIYIERERDIAAHCNHLKYVSNINVERVYNDHNKPT